MRYASVCDGIGAAHVAWQPLGWECAWTSEIEPFPAAVVDHHWKFKNLGDMTKLTEDMLNECGPVDLLVGGTPCQSFSVAGLRGGLADPRGNLALRFVQLVGVLRPSWLVWENVPGVLSSGAGKDFGTFLGALAELGYGFAYRVLDAQWFGVAQRRRRVFVVGHAGDWRRAAAVLFERESLLGNPPTRRKEGQRVAAKTAASPGVCGPLTAGMGRGVRGTETTDSHHAVVAFQGGSQQDQVLSGDAVCPALCHLSNEHKGHHQPKVVVPFTKSKRAQSTTDDETWVPGEVSPTMSCFDQGDTRATTVVAFDWQKGYDATSSKPAATHLSVDQTQTLIGNRVPAIAYDIHGTQSSKGASPTDCHTALQSRPPGQSEASTTTVLACDLYNHTVADDAFATLSTSGGGTASGPSVMQHSSNANDAVAFQDVHGTLRSNAGACRQATTGDFDYPPVMNGMAVRRLTPKECERLQGFPDGYTNVIYRGKPPADGPRYRALGNSMAVPVMAWIGQRIQMVEEATDGR
jgi:DNA (cytosine-5)-methyltransferase 1